ncbi:M14 family metallopeptidase [Curvibacter sp. APW13]|uniref:succinylglutamate desuccinylase/aspartoacylase family protein n=1 Tax=Curvibacter sp. APW13 TaxID=3077236 RepID=UPI0028DF046D|nr:M14 family metallopeptidase [Curvibacter sp. APW13]MDT8991678.1 M14 family metallopeptidase [Curvibacter sp. APW13]
MQRQDHPLLSPSLGVQKTLSSFHFGKPGSGTKVYIQASLHAEELPGMLVAHHLRPLLEAADAAGKVVGEVILVPMANPIGLAQRVDHKPMGRFELDTSENFNRHYPDLASAVLPMVRNALGDDGRANVATVRTAMGQYLRQWTPKTELESLRRQLLLLSHDADVVLDLHCDCQGVMHFYTEEACWPQLEPVARFIGSRATLLAKSSGNAPFDECLSGAWWKLADALRAEGNHAPLPQGCCSTTIELRGEADVHDRWARPDAQALFHYLQYAGVVACEHPPELPAALCDATPLAGSETLYAPCPGVVVFAHEAGERVTKGDLMVEIVNPIEQTRTPIHAGVDGVFYAHIRDRYVTTGCELGKIAGKVPFRTGDLLGN